MKKNINFILIILSIFYCKICAQNCDIEAEAAYSNLNFIINNAQKFCEKGDHVKEKKLAEQHRGQSEKIERKFKCYSPQAAISLWRASMHLGEFDEALMYAHSLAAHCEKFKLLDCSCVGESKLRTGLVYSAKGDDSLAIVEFKKSLINCPNNKLIEAFVLMKEGDKEKASNNLNKASIKYVEALNLLDEFIEVNNGAVHDFVEFIRGRCYCSKAEILLQQGECNEALPIFLMALRMAQINFDAKVIARCYYNIAHIYCLNSNYLIAAKNFDEAVKVAVKFGYNEIVVDSYNWLAYIKDLTGDFKQSYDFAVRALEIAKTIQYRIGIADAFNNFSYINRESGDNTALLSNAKSALALAKDEFYLEGMANAYYNISLYFWQSKHLKDSRAAIKEYSNLMLHAALEAQLPNRVIDSYNSLGDIFFIENELDSATNYFNLALNTSKVCEEKCGRYLVGIIDAYNGLGLVYKKMRKKDKSATNFYHALVLAEEIQYVDGIDIAKKGCEYATSSFPKILESKKTSK